MAQKNGAGPDQEKAKVEANAKQDSSDGKPSANDFETHAEFVEALTDWKLEQRESAAKRQANQSQLENAHKEVLKGHAERLKSFIGKTPDFEDALDNLDGLRVSAAVEEIVITSDNGPELMYELSKDRAEFERINSLSPLAAARALGRLESRISAQASEDPKPETKKLTKAPKPIEPVGAGKGSVRKSITDPDLSFNDYVRLRREQKRR